MFKCLCHTRGFVPWVVYVEFVMSSILLISCCRKLYTSATFADVMRKFIKFYSKFRCWLQGSYILHKLYNFYNTLCTVVNKYLLWSVGWTVQRHSEYFFSNDFKSHKGAEACCSRAGGSFTSITSYDENVFIKNR